MNGVHDLGGMHGFGPVVPEENEPNFHEPWEAQVFAMRRAMMAQGFYNIDETRYAIERMDPVHYLASGYYEHWLASLETLLLEKGVLSKEELDSRTEWMKEHPDAALPDREDPELVGRVVQRGATVGLAETGTADKPRFAVGDPVITRNSQPKGHTRLPRYARGKRGVIHRFHGVFTFPDTNAMGLGKQPQPVYSVRFKNSELWGEDADGRGNVYLDLWESYLRPAEGVRILAFTE